MQISKRDCGAAYDSKVAAVICRAHNPACSDTCPYKWFKYLPCSRLKHYVRYRVIDLS